MTGEEGPSPAELWRSQHPCPPYWQRLAAAAADQLQQDLDASDDWLYEGPVAEAINDAMDAARRLEERFQYLYRMKPKTWAEWEKLSHRHIAAIVDLINFLNSDAHYKHRPGKDGNDELYLEDAWGEVPVPDPEDWPK